MTAIKRYAINMEFERDYIISRRIGSGAYSCVYEVVSRREPNKRYAAKVMKKEEFTSDKLRS